MKKIMTRAELVQLALELGVRADWYEPDEQGVTVQVFGDDFDNAIGPGEGYGPHYDRYELYVVLSQETDSVTRDVAAVNLATLFAWATGYESDSPYTEAHLHKALHRNEQLRDELAQALVRARDAEAELARLRARSDVIDMDAEQFDKLRAALDQPPRPVPLDQSPACDRPEARLLYGVECAWRRRIAQEIRNYAHALVVDSNGNRSLRVAVSAIITEVAQHIEKRSVTQEVNSDDSRRD